MHNSMISSDAEKWLEKLSAFRAELADLAYAMDRRGRAEAADVALMAFARIGEICKELEPVRRDASSEAGGTN